MVDKNLVIPIKVCCESFFTDSYTCKVQLHVDRYIWSAGGTGWNMQQPPAVLHRLLPQEARMVVFFQYWHRSCIDAQLQVITLFWEYVHLFLPILLSHNWLYPPHEAVAYPTTTDPGPEQLSIWPFFLFIWRSHPYNSTAHAILCIGRGSRSVVKDANHSDMKKLNNKQYYFIPIKI